MPFLGKRIVMISKRIGCSCRSNFLINPRAARAIWYCFFLVTALAAGTNSLIPLVFTSTKTNVPSLCLTIISISLAAAEKLRARGIYPLPFKYLSAYLSPHLPKSLRRRSKIPLVRNSSIRFQQSKNGKEIDKYRLPCRRLNTIFWLYVWYASEEDAQPCPTFREGRKA